jgi:hypothetical protein
MFERAVGTVDKHSRSRVPIRNGFKNIYTLRERLMLLLLSLLRGGITQGVPSTATITHLFCVPRLSSNHSGFNHQSPMVVTGRHLIAKQ